MKGKIIAAVAGLVSIAPLYLLVLCIVSLIEWGITRNFAVGHILPCLLCVGGLWTVAVGGVRQTLCRRDWWIGGMGVLLGIGLELAFWLPLL